MTFHAFTKEDTKMSATNHRLVFDQKAKVARLQWDVVIASGFRPVPGGEIILTSLEDCDACAALQFLSEEQLLDLQWFFVDVMEQSAHHEVHHEQKSKEV